MKRILLIICYVFLAGCYESSNAANTETEVNLPMKLDIATLSKKAEKTKYDNQEEINYYWERTEKDGSIVITSGDKKEGFTETVIPKNSYFEIYREYYPDGALKQSGKLFGEKTAVGIWHYFDAQGNLIKTIDEDKKFGKFSYMNILDFLIKNNYVEKGTHKGIFKTHIVYMDEEKAWYVRVKSSGYMINDYIIDGNTGEIKQQKVFQGGRM